jgi:hypothetical protein
MKTKPILQVLTFIVAGLALLVGLLTACAPTPAGPVTPTSVSPFATQTAAAVAVQATQSALAVQATQLALDTQSVALQATQTAIAAAGDGAQPSPAPTHTPALPSPTSLPPTSTPSKTAVPTATRTPTPKPAACSNKAWLIEENYPEPSTILAGQFITKIWKVQNVGTCTWTAEYTLAVLNGATLNYRTSVARNWRMPVTVKPGMQVSLPFELYAPFTGGDYSASFMLVAPDGAYFGVGEKAATPLSARLKVADAAIPQQESALLVNLGLGKPTWEDTFQKDDGRWALKIASNSLAKFWMTEGEIAMMAKEIPSYRWVIGTHVPSYSQFVQASFTSGPTCAGADGYGLVLRAEDVGGGRFNRAYVFQFTCDGRFRLYYMNDGTPEDLLPLSASPHIKSGPGQENRMSVLLLGKKFVVYANGEKIAELQNPYASDHRGFYGLMITAEQTQNLLVFVDNFKLWRLD